MASKTQNSNGDFSLKEFYKSFTVESLFLGLQCIICHPSNQTYLYRLEYLVAELLSIPEKNFGNINATTETFETLFAQTKKQLDDTFSVVEDFQGFNQNNLIPLFFDGKTFNFFYGLFDRPYETWNELIDIYSSEALSNLPDFANLSHLIIKSLEWQTHLLQEITAIKESKIDVTGVYIPTPLFIDRIKKHFTQENTIEPALTFGALKKAGSKNLHKNAKVMEKYINELYVQIGGNTFILYPHIHLKVILAKTEAAIVLNTANHAAFMDGFRRRLTNSTMGVFKKPTVIYQLLAQSHREDFLLEIADTTYQFDENKLILFKAIPYAKGKKLSQEINAQVDKIETIINKTSSENAVGLNRGRKERMLALVTEHVQVYVVLVFEDLNQSTSIYPKKNNTWGKIWLFSMTDLKSIFEQLKTPINFLKFLLEEKYLLSTVEIPKGTAFIDRFRWFLFNGHCYLSNGDRPRRLVFPSHQWSTWYAEQSFNRLAADLDIYTEVEKTFPGQFPVIEKYATNVYSLSEPINFETCYLAKVTSGFVYIYLPDDPLTLDYKDFSIATGLLGPMFGDYVARLDTLLTDLLNENEISEFSILVVPTGFLNRDKEYFLFLEEYLGQIGENNPCVFITLPIGVQSVRTYFIIDPLFSHKIFATPANEGERALLLEFLRSIAFLRQPPSAALNVRLANIVDLVMPIGKKGYGMDQLTIDNPDIDDYGPPIESTDTDNGVAKRTVALFLRENGYSPGNYEKENAKQLFQDTHDYLQNLLETEIASFHEEIVVFGYKQLEKNEGQIEQRKLKAGLRENRQLNYNLLESLQKDMIKDGALASAIRLLLHTSIKVIPRGIRHPTRMDWSYLLGIAEQIIEATTNWDYLSQDLRKINIVIDQHYKFSVVNNESAINFVSYTRKDSERKLQYAVKEFKRSNQVEEIKGSNSEQTVAEKSLLKEQELDKVFLATFNVAYSHVILILYVLSKMELPQPSDFPVYVLEKDHLAESILSNITISISVDEILNILRFLTLYQGIFSSNKFLYFGAMLRNRERITLCPVVELENGLLLFGRECIDGTLAIWSDVFHGNLPFKAEQNSALDKCMKEMQAANGKWLENKAEEKATQAVGRQYVEAKINNFQRLSESFSKKEPCGEIDLLCINPTKKTAFVFDCKSLVKMPGIFQAKRNIKEFFDGEKSYINKLQKKKEFVENNLFIILDHFRLPTDATWIVKEGFIINQVHFAAFYKGAKVDFIDLEELSTFILR